MRTPRKKWNCIGEFFNYLNHNIEYVILRGEDEYLSTTFMDSNKDIDIICRNKRKFVAKTGLIFINARNLDFSSGIISVAGKNVRIDLYSPGDGCFDSLWMKSMLEKRVKDSRGNYILNKEDRLYSKLYHVLLHKENIPQKYVDYFKYSGELDASSEYSQLNEALNKYMRTKGYKYTAYDSLKAHNGYKMTCYPLVWFRIRLRDAFFTIKKILWGTK